MTEKLQVYKCDICGNIVVVLHAGAGTLVCCGQPMTLLAEKTGGPGSEKHLPVVSISAEGIKVKVGSVEHPMEEGHYIGWVEVIAGGVDHVFFLSPGDKPEVELPVPVREGTVEVRAFCNKHGLWKAAVPVK